MFNIENVTCDLKTFSRFGDCYGSADTLRKELFVRLWQSSSSLDELMSRVEKINEVLLDKGGIVTAEDTSLNFLHGIAKYKIPKWSNSYLSRAAVFRSKGVNLKTLKWEQDENKLNPESWENLAKLAEQLA